MNSACSIKSFYLSFGTPSMSGEKKGFTLLMTGSLVRVECSYLSSVESVENDATLG